MTIDSDPPFGAGWYTGTGDAPDCCFDVWSVATHEWGHMTAFFGHFDEGGSICPDDSSRHTMCPTIKAATERQRTLELHDYHTFEAAY
jgi:hypothetical protein